MRLVHWIPLCVLSLAILLAVASFQDSPGYMDADYYFAGGLRLYHGFGFQEMILWNYLDDPDGIPHPSHTYWMPLTSILALLGMKLAGSDTFAAAKIVFLIIAGCIVLVTAALAYSLNRDKGKAILAGLLAALPGFYISYLGTTDSFGVSMLLGAVFFLIVGHTLWVAANVQALCLGSLAGLMHLTRADGLLWLLLAFVVVNAPSALAPDTRNTSFLDVSWRGRIRVNLSCLLGYGIVFGPWVARNALETGALLGSGGLRTLWLTSYNDLYAYPASQLTPARWWSSGLSAILLARLDAFWQNFQTAMIVQGQIYLVPLIGLGLWVLRKDRRVKIGVLGWLLTFLAMTLVFPFIGWRGGFFHSGAAFQPLFWAVAPVGLDRFIQWGVLRRGWDTRQAQVVFSIGLVGLCLLLSGMAVSKRVIGSNLKEPVWDESWQEYARIERDLQAIGAKSTAIVLVNNPPGYYIATGRAAISIPDGNVDTTCLVAQRYDAGYLILEKDHPSGLSELFEHPRDLGCLRYMGKAHDAYLYAITE